MSLSLFEVPDVSCLDFRCRYLKMTLGLKHYALYNVEVDRPSFIPNVTAHDLWETYLPQYALGFSAKDLDGNPAG